MFDQELETICHNNQIHYIFMKNVLDKGDYIDGLHPNQLGHKKIYEKVKNDICK